MKEARFSRIGFILAAAGSAVGLGNIWRFPYIVGENGGGAFVLVYIAAIAIGALPLLIAEVLIGKMTRKDAVGAFEELAPTGKKVWRFAGFQFVTSLVILSFYAVVVGWVLAYFIGALSYLPPSGEEAKTRFDLFLSRDITSQAICHLAAILLTGAAVVGGVKRGIERANKIMMPMLFIALVFLLCYAATLPSFGAALKFMFAPDFSKLSIDAVLAAIGQSFFSMSVGMAILITYSASASSARAAHSAIAIGAIDTIVALAAGVAIFTFLFNDNLASAQGAGLAFISMPTAFAPLGAFGHVAAAAFFAALLFASLTSTISILEPTALYLIRRFGWSRVKATWIPLAFAYVVGIFALLSNADGFDWLVFAGQPLLDWIDYATSTIMLPLGAFFMAIFIGWIADRGRIAHELSATDGLGKIAIKLWFFMVRFVAPFALIAVVIAKVSGL